MPVYDFQCDKCGTVFELERPIGATGKVRCVACGSQQTTKLFSAAGIVFKGAGFHVTDYRRPASDDSSKSKPSDNKQADGGKSTGQKETGGDGSATRTPKKDEKG